MANEASSVFNQSARERLRNPDDLDRCVRVTSPSVWVMLGAVLLLIFGLLSWGIFGVVTVGVEDVCIFKDGQLVGFVDERQASLIEVGDAGKVDDLQVNVTYVGDHATTRDEALKKFKDDAFVDLLFDGDECYPVYLSGNDSLKEGMAYNVTIVTDKASPLSLVFG